MGALLLLLAYGVTSGVLGLAAAALLKAGSRRHLLGPTGVAAWMVLTLLPLPFVAQGFLPGKVLAPTGLLTDVAPWVHPDLVELVRDESAPQNPLLIDPLSQMEPWREAARRDWLFNPAASSGAALLANGQGAVLFPLEMVARQLPPVRGTTYAQAAKLLLAAWGMFLLLRTLAVHQGPALLGACVFTGSAFLQLWRMHTLSYVAALTPWLIVALIRLVRRPGPGNAAVVGGVGALGVFAGHPETLLQCLTLGVLAVTPLLLRRPSRLRRTLPWAAGAALLAALLAAPLLLPFVENLRVSAEWQHRQEGGHQDPEKPVHVALALTTMAVDLFAFGDPRDGTPIGPWVGPQNLAERGGAALSLAALALAAAAFARRRYRRSAVLWLGLGLLGLLVSAHWPWISKPFGWTPLIRDSLLNRLQLWWAVAVCVLAAYGASALLRGKGRRWVLTATVALACLLALMGDALPTERSPGYEGFLALQLAAIAAVAALFRRRLLLASMTTLALLPTVAAFDNWIPASSAFSYYPETPAVRYVQERAEGYRVTGLHSALLPHSAAFFGLEEVRGYDPMAFAPYQEFLDTFTEPRRPLWNVVADWRHPALDFLGVRYLFDHPTMYVFQHPGVEQVYESEDALVYENPGALPRVYRPEELLVVPSPEAVVAAAAITDYAHAVAVSNAALPPGRHANGAAEVSGLRMEGRRIFFRVRAAEATVVATSQPAIPGWRVEEAPAEASLVTVNGAFLGLSLPPGSHPVALAYRPRSWDLGRALFALGLLGLAGFAWAERRRCSTEVAESASIARF